MKPYGVKRKDAGCCPGHDKFSSDRYNNDRGEKRRREQRPRKKRARRMENGLILVDQRNFIEHLEAASKKVASWPVWKRHLLG